MIHDDEQHPFGEGKVDGILRKFIADAQGEGVFQMAMIQFVLGIADGKTLAGGGIGEQREAPIGLASAFSGVAASMKMMRSGGKHRNAGFFVFHGNSDPAGGQIGQRLKIGNGMVQTTTDPADDQEGITALFQTVFDAEHGVGIILLHGNTQDLAGKGFVGSGQTRIALHILEGIEISDDHMGKKAFPFCKTVTAVGTEDQRLLTRGM